MSGDDQIAMKRKINAQLDKLRRDQRERLERQARRRAWAAGLAMLALFIALFIALCLASWRQQQVRDAELSSVMQCSAQLSGAQLCGALPRIAVPSPAEPCVAEHWTRRIDGALARSVIRAVGRAAVPCAALRCIALQCAALWRDALQSNGHIGQTMRRPASVMAGNYLHGERACSTTGLKGKRTWQWKL